jgi:hypothetical protein
MLMTEERLRLLLERIDEALELARENEYEVYLQRCMWPAKVEIERQLGLLSIEGGANVS